MNPDLKKLFITTDKSQLFCKTFGKGEPIIVIHGGPGLSHDYLLPQMAKLAETNLVIFYDQRGCGLSTGEINAESIQIESFVDDLEAIRKYFGYEKISILGHSWGGFLAMKYAIAHPEFVNKLILLNSAPASFDEYSLFLQEAGRRMESYRNEIKWIIETPEFVKGEESTTQKYYQTIFGRYFYDPEKVKLLNLQMKPSAFLNGSKVYGIFSQNLLGKPFNLHEQLKKLDITTLIIHGDSDPVPPCTAQKLHESIQGSKYHIIKNCGHFPYVETPDELFLHLNNFLRDDYD